MLCKRFLTLFLWFHCHHLVLNPILQLLSLGLNYNGFSDTSISSNKHHNLGLYVQGAPITAAANRVTLTPGQEIALRCNIAEYPDAQFTWLRTKKHPISENIQEEERKELDHSDDRYSINNNIIIIKSSTLADVGDYFCRVKDSLEDVAETEKMISVRPKPFIQEFDIESSTSRSAVVEEGKALKIPCRIVDDFFPPESIRVSWQMAKYDEADMNDVISGEDGIRVEIQNSTSQDLIIDQVTKNHRGLYKCRVTNGITENSKTILIRVKDKYIAIWPAVGIIIELVILIGVICVVENRKVEPDRDVYDRKAIQM